MDTCIVAGNDLPQNSYATYLPQVIGNQGRGGDTCTVQAAYSDGVFAGQPRGLLARLHTSIEAKPQQISVLIGTNDLNLYNVSETDLMACITEVWQQIQTAGIEPIALTYGAMPAQKGWSVLNQDIRAAAALKGIRVVDMETISTYHTSDGIHPDQATAESMANLFKATIH